METLTYRNADRALIRALPELAAPHQRHAAEEDGGQYLLFEGVFAVFIEVLLALPTSPARDALLRRAFALVDALLHSGDRDARDLIAISVYEGRPAWWFARAGPYLGPVAQAALDASRPGWREAARQEAGPEPGREIIDLYGVRDAVFAALRHEQPDIAALPGISAPRPWARLAALREAQRDPCGTLVLSCFGPSAPYVVCPAGQVAADEPALLRLAQDLAELDHDEPQQREKAASACYRIAPGERVWNMRTGDDAHGRYEGKLWLRADLVARGLAGPICQVLRGERDSL